MNQEDRTKRDEAKEGAGHMQTKRSLRKRVSLMAEYVTEGVNRPVFIGNVFEEGMHMVTLNKDAKAQFFPGKNVELKLRLESGERIPLRCEVRWVSDERPPYGATYGVGLEIIDPLHYMFRS